MLTATALVDVVRETPRNKREKGQCATFIDLKNGYGLKYYVCERNRDDCYKKQKYAHSIGIAPAVGGMLNFTIDNQEYYGFITEKVKVAIYLLAERVGVHYHQLFDRNHYLKGIYYGENDDIKHEIKCSNEFRDLQFKMEKYNIFDNDLHLGNIGIREDGSYVMIDFDYSSMPTH